MSLNLILNQACDSVTYVQVMRLLENVHNRKRNVLAICINEASGLMWSGQFSDALALAESLRKYKVSVSSQLSLLNIRFNCHTKNGRGRCVPARSVNFCRLTLPMKQCLCFLFIKRGWLGMDMSFYSNASDNMAVIMDCGDLEVLCGAASEAGYEKLMEVMKDIGEVI